MRKLYFLSVLTILSISQMSAQFTQTALPYSYSSLEPHIDAQTMEIHYSKHHAGYVANLNKALDGKPEASASIIEVLSKVSVLGDAVRNNAGGHYNHELFWSVLTPNKGTQPSDALLKAIEKHFGSLDELKALMNNAAATRFGSGWAWLYVAADGSLAVCSTPNQDNPLMDIAQHKGTPILGIDVWEHAYYLKYQNKRGDYLSEIWNVLNWDEVSKRYQAAKK
jgi:superoxide dismutase, Fe-Mn family